MENIHLKLLNIDKINPNYYDLLGSSSENFCKQNLQDDYKKQLQKLQRLGNNPKYKAAILYLKSELRKARTCIENEELKQKYDEALFVEKHKHIQELTNLFSIKGYIHKAEWKYLEKKAHSYKIAFSNIKKLLDKKNIILKKNKNNWKKDIFYILLLIFVFYFPFYTETKIIKKSKIIPIKTKFNAFSKKDLKIPSHMIYVPKGYFYRGDEKGDMDESPIKKIYLDDFYISKFEVTNEDYAKFIMESDDSVPYTSKISDREFNWDPLTKKYPQNKMKYPVVLISWKNAMNYCRWLSKRLEVTVTLPTEAQWEKAARGSDNLSQYPWGPFSQFQQNYANYDLVSDGFSKTAPVISFANGCSPFGCYNMAGNVSEWCLDSYRENAYSFLSLHNPAYLDKNKGKVIRGGSWGSSLHALRVSNRNSRAKDHRSVYIGFRYVILVTQK